ncbi:MAG: trigger factor [Provencibacterium sp.]|jgi:trigger factor|nr:trigger factor [Provencibacterium sp.]
MTLTSQKKIETNKYELIVAVGADEFAPAVDRAFRKNIHRFNVPGFRRGKAPKSVVYKMYGEGVFYEDAVNELYPKAYQQALEEAKLEPVSYPKVEITEVNAEGFTFRAEVVVKPEVEVGEYKGIKAAKEVKTVEDSEIDEELDRRRRRNARMLTVSDRPAKQGDTAVIDYEGFVDGVPFEGGKGEGHHLRLGSGQFIPGFEDQVAGHSTGEEFDVNVTFPEQYHEELKGKDATFKVKLLSIEEEQLPELDDEFAKDVSEFDTLEALKADIREKLQEQKNHQAQDAFEDALIDKVIEGLTGEIPTEMYDNKVEEMMHDYEYRLQAQGIPMEMYLQYMGQTAEAFKESFREPAERQVKIRLALEKIVELEGITVSEQEVEAEYARIAEQYKGDVEKLKSSIPAAEIKKDLAVQKAIDIVRDNAVVTGGEQEAPEKPKKRTRRTKKAAEESEEA